MMIQIWLPIETWGVQLVMGVPLYRWMVYKGFYPVKMDDDWGYAHSRKPAYVYTTKACLDMPFN